MSKRRHHQIPPHESPQGGVPRVPSLLDAVVDGKEYESIIGLAPPDNLDPVQEVQRAVGEIERIRGRHCVADTGNVIKAGETSLTECL